MRTFLVMLAWSLAVAGCEHDVKLGSPTAIDKRLNDNGELDILFVIDNSASTLDKQTLFASNLPAFIAELDTFPNGRPSLHIGVVSTTVDLGVPDVSVDCPFPNTSEDGRLQNTARAPDCTPPNDRYIADTRNPDGTRTINYTGTLADTLSCIGVLGADGCGYEAPLEAMKRALDGSRPENAGFLRPEADLAVVVLTDEDDCSVADTSLFSLDAADAGPGDFRCQPLASYTCDQPISPTTPGTYTNCAPTLGGYLHDPSEFVDFLATIKDPSETSFALIAGDPEPGIATGPLPMAFDQTLALLPSCTATIDGAPVIGRPAIRLSAVEQAFGDRGVFQTVCQSDYSAALATSATSMTEMMQPCLDGNIATADIDADNPGIQLPCTVTERTDAGTAAEQDTVLPACEMLTATSASTTNVPCWWAEKNVATCSSTASGMLVHPALDEELPSGAVIDISCPVAD